MNSDSQNSGDNKKIKIITDDPAEEDALDFQLYSQNLANIIKEAEPKFAVGIFGKWGTGKTTLMRMIKRELDKDSDKILTVWFDAWRYEREKHLAVIPFLRQIRIALDNDLAKRRKTSRWEELRQGLGRTFTAFLESTQLSVSVPGSPASPTINLETFVDSLQSKGSVHMDDERIQLHEHVTDHLKNALERLKNPKSDNGMPGTRIVIFVDDLDRCTPEKAVEVLESIKAFFDIEGIVYVIGMDSDSIDYIIKQKYGENSGIKGLNYLQKIVQLPFQIPVWNYKDIEGSIDKIISKGLEGSELVQEFLDPTGKRKRLIVNAIEPNPRQVKRFVNNIILAKSVFSKPDKDIHIDKMIAIQALNFRSEWNKFLELITPDPTRKIFFEDYYIPLKKKGKDALDNFMDAVENTINTGKSQESEGLEQVNSELKVPLPMRKEIIDIFKELKKPTSVTLRSFLDAGADEILLSIKVMEDYRRALEVTKVPKEEELKGLNRVSRLIAEGIRRFAEDNKIPLTEIISFETEFMSSVHQWFSNMSNEEDRLHYSPVRELTMINLRDQIAELKKAHDRRPTEDKEKIILANQKKIAEMLWNIDSKMPP